MGSTEFCVSIRSRPRAPVVLDAFAGAPLGGPNDLVFADNGDLYFTDPGRSSLGEPVGRVFCIRADARARWNC